jgi:hypothetical protein
VNEESLAHWGLSRQKQTMVHSVEIKQATMAFVFSIFTPFHPDSDMSKKRLSALVRTVS